MDKVWLSSLVDCFVWISETIGVGMPNGFLSNFPPYVPLYFLLLCRRDVFIYKYIMSNKRKKTASYKSKQRDNVNKAKPPPHFHLLL
jgi:hypothetical protein